MLRTAVHTVRHVLNTQPHQLSMILDSFSEVIVLVYVHVVFRIPPSLLAWRVLGSEWDAPHFSLVVWNRRQGLVRGCW